MHVNTSSRIHILTDCLNVQEQSIQMMKLFFYRLINKSSANRRKQKINVSINIRYVCLGFHY